MTISQMTNGDHAQDDPASTEPIAVVGMACRLPGGVHSADELWDFLHEGRSAKSDVPASRFNVDAFYNPQSELPDTVAMRGGFFLDEELHVFDNGFFGVNNLEAMHLDPQMRKLLEVCYECLESGGIRLTDIAGKNVGCYIGNFTMDYAAMCGKDPGHQHRLAALTLSAAILSNRVSYLFDIMGPSLTLDTACSSSLYCLDLAVNALRNGDCDAAFVGGANLIQSFEQYMHIARFGFLSRTSQCHSFDSSADGYARAEGVGALYIKRLSDAIRDGDPIRSIIRGTAINSNGRTTTNITVPSGIGQKKVIAKAYRNAGLKPDFTDYIECHGTGTQVGDMIEVSAVSESMRTKAGDHIKPLFIGTAKTNFGHSEATSGITSILKATLALEHEWIPSTIGVKELNPNIDWKSMPLQVVTTGMPWPQQSNTRRIGINSFGFGGANGHCILEKYPASPARESEESDGIYPILLPLSAASLFSLRHRVQDLRKSGPLPMRDLAYTLMKRRSTLAYRGFILAQSSQWQQSTDLEHHESDTSIRHQAVSPLVFVFTGQGAQWAGMGKELFAHFPTFRRSIMRTDEALAEMPYPPGWLVTDVFANTQRSDQFSSPLHSQVICTSLQIGLVDLLKEWKAFPRYVIGHSAGEIAAAYAAGHISASTAVKIAYERGLKVSSLPATGAMAAVGLGTKEAQAAIRKLDIGDRVSVACINSPESVTVSGDAPAIDLLLEDLVASNIFARRLKTSGIAYHSAHMRAIGMSYQHGLELAISEFQRSCSQKNEVEMISSTLGRVVTSDDTATASYWRSNLESPVHFCQAIQILQSPKNFQIIEIGPHSTLELPIKQTLSQEGTSISKHGDVYLPSILRHQDSVICLMRLTGKLWCRGYDISLDTVNQLDQKSVGIRKPRVLTNLPRYRWNYTDGLWVEPRRSKEYRHRAFAHDELLGTLVPGLSGSTTTWRNVLAIKDVPWLVDHKLSGEVVFPAAGYIDMGVKAIQQLHVCDNEYIMVKDLHLLSVLTLSDNQNTEIFTEAQRTPLSNVEDYTASWTFTISTHSAGKTVKRAVGLAEIHPLRKANLVGRLKLEGKMEPLQRGQRWYRQFSKVGIEYGPRFQALKTVSTPRMRDKAVCHAQFEGLKVPHDAYQPQYAIRMHPTVIDTMFQAGIIAQSRGNIEEVEGLMPHSISCIRFFPSFKHADLPTYEMWTHEKSSAAGISEFDCELLDQEGRVVMDYQGDAKWYSQSGFQIAPVERHPFIRIEWVPDLRSMPRSESKLLANLLVEATQQNGGQPNELLQLLYFTGVSCCDNNILAVTSLDKRRLIWEALGGGTAHPRFTSLTFATRDENDLIRGHTIDQTARPRWEELAMKPLPEEHVYDVIVDDQSISALDTSALLANGGLLMSTGEGEFDSAQDASMEHMIIQAQSRINLIRRRPAGASSSSTDEQSIMIVINGEADSFNDDLSGHLSSSSGARPLVQALEDIDPSKLSKETIVIVTAELRSPVLTKLRSEQLDAIKQLANSVSRLIWIVSDDPSQNANPDLAAVLGLSRSVVLENPALSFQTLILESHGTDTAKDSAWQCVHQVLHKEVGVSQEQSFKQHRGLLHVSRFVPDEELNSGFNEVKTKKTAQVELESTKYLEMDIGAPGQFDTLKFKELPAPPRIYGADDDDLEVDVQVKAIGLNFKDLFALSGKVTQRERIFANDFAGVICKARPGSKFSVGDRVAWLSGSPFATFMRIPEAICVRLADGESFTQMATVPLVFATAVHALEDRARLMPHESVLIHSAAGGVGMAAVQIARKIGATIYATVGSPEKKEYLVSQFGLLPENIFNSRDTSFLDDIKRATKGRGVDVVLNSLTGEKFRAGLACLATFGRFIEIGKKDIAEAGNLNLSSFGRSITFGAFDLNDFYFSENRENRLVLPKLTERGFEIFRADPLPPPRVFDIGQLAEAYRAFSNSKRVGKICVSFEEPSSLISVQPTRFRHRLSATKAYLLVGCLGGIGRSISRYLFENGARHFVYLSKSGADKLPAEQLVRDLRDRDAYVEVVKGDVADYDLVQQTVTSLRLPVGGVVQAAMALEESLFSSMTPEKWHAGLDPKVRGTRNLHNALQDHDQHLEFFLMISSLTGSYGAIAESNYCAANAFLDAFASFRRRQNKPANTLALGRVSEVGYLHDRPEIEEMMNRRGLAASTEADVLHMLDVVLRHPDRPAALAHTLAGLEAVRDVAALGGSQLPPEMADPRLSILVHAGKTLALSSGGGKLAGAPGDGEGLPPLIQAAIEAKDKDGLVQAVVHALLEKLSQLILTPEEEIPVDMTLANAGVDSMLAAELRSFVFHKLKLDLPFMTLMDAQTTVAGLGGKVAEKLLA